MEHAPVVQLSKPRQGLAGITIFLSLAEKPGVIGSTLH